MASSGGKRAAGTDGQDFKYRQRVDDHYKIMAGARKTLKSAARLQLASALGLVGAAGVALVLPAPLDTATMGLCVVAAIVSGVAGKSGLGTAQARQPEKQLGSYSTMCKSQLASGLLAAGLAAASAVMAESGELSWVAVVCLFAVLGAVGSALGLRSAKALGSAFEEQARKKATQ